MRKKFSKPVSLFLAFCLICSSVAISAMPVEEVGETPVPYEGLVDEPNKFSAASEIMSLADLYAEYVPGPLPLGPPLIVDGDIYPVAVELPLGISPYSAGNDPHAMADGHSRWYIDPWNGSGSQNGTVGPPDAFSMADYTAARYIVVEYDNPPGARIGLSSPNGSNPSGWTMTWAQMLTLSDVNRRIFLQGDGVKTRFVFDLGAPYIKAATASTSLIIANEMPAGSRLIRAYSATYKADPADFECVDFVSLTANGTPDRVTTTALTLTFDKPITGLTADDITVTGAMKGELSGTGPTYTLGVSGFHGQGTTIHVSLQKPNVLFTPSSYSVAANFVNEQVAFTGLTANGAADTATTTQLTLTFDKVIPNFTPGDITVTGASKGLLNQIGATGTYTLDISRISANVVTVELAKVGFDFNPSGRTVPVHTKTIHYVSGDRKTWHLTDWKIAPEDTITTMAGVGNAKAANVNTTNWVPAKVPGTVLGALLDSTDDNISYKNLFAPDNDGKKDVYFDANVMHIPRDDFEPWWWYSIDIPLTAEEVNGRSFNLNLKQISYQGEVFVNGMQVYNNNLNITDDRELQNKAGTGANTGNGSNPQPPYSFNNNAIGMNGGFPGGNAAWSLPDESPGYKSSVSMYGNDDFDLYKDQFIGTYRTYDVDITDYLTAGNNNIKVRVKRMFNVVDFGPFYHDWHPAAPDNNMGLNGNVTLTSTGAARLSSPLAASKVEAASITPAGNGNADLSFYVDLTNMSNGPIEAVINAVVKDPQGVVVPSLGNISKTVTVPAGYYNWDVPVLENHRLTDAQLWWTYGANGTSTQPLYTIEYTVKVGANVSDTLTHRFGIREMGYEVNNYTNANNAHTVQIYVNHQPIVMKGGGFSTLDMYYRHNGLVNRNFVEIVKSMGHNFWRDEGKFYSEDLYDLMDENGILLMTGYMCCDRNEATSGADVGNGRIDLWSKAERFIVYESTYSQLRIIRQYAAGWTWLNGSDRVKSAQSGNSDIAQSQASIERKMLEIAGKTRWYQTGHTISNAESGNSQLIGGNSGVRMQMGYDTLPPGHFFTGVNPNDNAGVSGINSGIQTFISEGSGGMGVPVLETLRKMIPDENMWPYNQGHVGTGTGPGNYNKWNYHANRAAVFEKLDISNTWIENAYGHSNTIEEYNIRAQLYQYDYQRATHEALHMRRFNKATGFVNWMLNGPRPSIFWNQFDYYLNPHGGTYGTAKGNSPVHIMYDMFDRKVHVMNNTRQDIGEVTATLKMYDIYGNQINNTMHSTFHLNQDGITSWLNPNATVMRTMGFIPEIDGYNDGPNEGDQWFMKPFTTYQAQYSSTATGRRAAAATGNHTPWNNDAIVASLIKPTTDVFFVSLELTKGNEVIARNDYAVPRKRDVLGASGNAGNLIEMSQTSDLTQLNELPIVNLAVTEHTGGLIENGKFWQQTVTIANPTGNVAYGIELKAYTDLSKKELTPVNYSDNLITLFPGESRTVTIWHIAENLGKAAVIDVNCYNNIIKDKPARGGNVYVPGDPGSAEWNAWDGVANTMTATSTTTNLARNVNSGTSANPTGISDATRLHGTANTANTFVTNALIRSNTVIDGAITNSVTLTPGQALYIHLGSSQTFDKIVAHWNHATMYYWASIIGGLGVPDKITVEISASTGNTADWNDIAHRAVFDNTKSRSMTTVILLDNAITGRHIRLIPEGTTTPSAEYGISNASEFTQEYNFGNGSVIRGGANFDHKSGRLNDSVKPRPHITGGTLNNPTYYAMNRFFISSVEVYNTYHYIYVDALPEKFEVTVNGRTIDKDTPAYLAGADRHLKKFAGIDMKFEITSGYPVYDVYLDGEKITNQLSGNALTLTDALTEGNSVLTLKVPVTQIRIDALSIFTVARYGVYHFSYSLNEGAVSNNIRWQIADPSLGYVDDNGQVTIFDKIGNVRLTATDVETGVSHSITLRIAS